MKILFLHDEAALLGGAEIMLSGLRGELERRGHSTRLLAGRKDASLAVDYPCWATDAFYRNLLRVGNPSALLQLRRALREFRPDVVHVRMFLGQLSPAILPFLRSLPCLYHAVMYEAVCPTGTKMWPDKRRCQVCAGAACLRCLSPQAWAPLMLQRHLLRQWRGAFDATVANSQALALALEQDDWADIQVIPNGVPAVPARSPLGERPVLAYAGRLSREKGLPVLMGAFRRLRGQRPDALLLVAGEGPEEALVRDQENVQWLGWVAPDRLAVAFDSAWAQVVPSIWDEPFGLVAAEALMRGTAVLASGSGGLMEIVRPGVTGLHFAPGDEQALSEAMLVVTDRETAERMGREARADALQRFPLAGMVDRLEACYGRLLTARSRTGFLRSAL